MTKRYDRYGEAFDDVAALPVRVPGYPGPHRLDRLLLVDDPTDGEIAVRWCISLEAPLRRCKACGAQSAADCVHSFSAAVYLARDLLGLKPNVTTPERKTQ